MIGTKYLWFAGGAIVFLLAIYFAGHQNGYKKASNACKSDTQDQQISVQNEIIDVVKKSKVISKNNAGIERNALIDRL